MKNEIIIITVGFMPRPDSDSSSLDLHVLLGLNTSEAQTSFRVLAPALFTSAGLSGWFFPKQGWARVGLSPSTSLYGVL